jgi:CheY-like chemotaxis protein
MPRPRILVVDDSATVLRIVEAALSGEYDVETAADGVEALAQARQSRPDLIVTDSLMPNLDGFGLLRTLNADPRTRAIPAIVLTSQQADEVLAVPQDIPLAALVTKSMDMTPLLSAVRTALSARIGL